MRTFRAYLQLMRFPAVFTAMADIFLGYLLTHPSLKSASEFAWLLASSSCLYLSGMVLNDVFDREVDARERPQRPIPAKLVSVRSASWLGGMLMAMGSLCAFVAGPKSFQIALLLAGAVLLYDGLLKSTLLGPVAMGSCRLLNVMLGASAADLVWARPQTLAAGALGLYVAGITWFARQESGQSRRSSLIPAAVVMNLGLVGIAALVSTWPGEAHWPWQEFPDPSIVFVLLAGIVFVVDRRLLRAVKNPSAATVQRAVKGSLMSLIFLDATLVFFKTGRLDLAVATALLVVPAMVMARWLYVT